MPAQKYESGERTANNLIKWATRSVPNKIKVLPNPDDVSEWLDKVRVLLFVFVLLFVLPLLHSSLHSPRFAAPALSLSFFLSPRAACV